MEEDKIFVMDQKPYLKVFDAFTGTYLYNIGKQGRGPGELPYLSNVDINPYTHTILLNWRIVNKFNFQGKFQGSIKPPSIDSVESVSSNMVMMQDNLYAGGIRYYGGNQQNLIAVFDSNKLIINKKKCYENFIQMADPSLVVWSPFDQAGVFYRTQKEVRYFRGISDTIYSYSQQQRTYTPVFVFNYGKHKTTCRTVPGLENKDLVKIKSVSESKRYIFLDFDTKKASPEPFEDEFYRGESCYNYTNTSILGIFDKKKETLSFLLQPIPGIRGFKNDIDQGIPFRVRSVTSKGQMIDYYHACKFLEYAKKIKAPNGKLKATISEVSEGDNPIIVIAQ